jgi:hypothetical protein
MFNICGNGYIDSKLNSFRFVIKELSDNMFVFLILELEISL